MADTVPQSISIGGCECGGQGGVKVGLGIGVGMRVGLGLRTSRMDKAHTKAKEVKVREMQ